MIDAGHGDLVGLVVEGCGFGGVGGPCHFCEAGEDDALVVGPDQILRVGLVILAVRVEMVIDEVLVVDQSGAVEPGEGPPGFAVVITV